MELAFKGNTDWYVLSRQIFARQVIASYSVWELQ